VLVHQEKVLSTLSQDNGHPETAKNFSEILGKLPSPLISDMPVQKPVVALRDRTATRKGTTLVEKPATEIRRFVFK
jgi:hypothetical protein